MPKTSQDPRTTPDSALPGAPQPPISAPPPTSAVHGAALGLPDGVIEDHPRVAVVGAGPAGLYLTEILLGQVPGAQVDVFEALPSPFGLIRYGVAPDHPRIRSIVDSLHQILSRPEVHFWGNIKLGRDLTAAELRHYYDVIVLATGALRDAPLDLPGSDLPGCFGGADFVAWYDSHPWYPPTWSLDARQVAIIGNGNVALDIARVLARRPQELARTDMPKHVLVAFEASALTDIHIFGRRGPAAVKFSPLELRELGEVVGLKMLLDEADFELDDAAQAAIKANGRLRQAVKTLQTWRAGHDGLGERRLHLHFYWRPERVEGTVAVTGLTLRRTEPDGSGGVVDTPTSWTIPVQAVYRATGYFGSPVEGVPFDPARGTIPNAGGRVLDDAADPIPGLYATGWIKRGPVGLIGSTKSDALETVSHIVADLATASPAPERSTSQLLAELERRGSKPVPWRGWLAIDAQERARGAAEGRERAKFATAEEMVNAAREPLDPD